MKQILSLAIFLFSFWGLQGAQKEVQILTDGDDYGLELEWAHAMTCGEMSIQLLGGVSDTMGNTYVCGDYQRYLQFPDGTRLDAPDYYNAGYVAKYNRKGDLLWTFNFEGTCVCGISEIWLMPSGEVLVFGKVNINEFHETEAVARFNGEKKIECTFGYECGDDCEKNSHEMLIKINGETGAYVDHVFVDTRETKRFDISPSGDIYFYSYIDERFKGLDTLRLKSDTRTHGGWDAYLAKITPDFKLAWDFAIGGERHDVPWVPVTAKYYQEYFGYYMPYDEAMVNWLVVVDDTLYLKAAIFSKNVDIDMDPTKEVLLSPTECEHDAVIAKYLLKKEGYPELLDYVQDYSLWLPQRLYKANNGHLMAYDQDENNRLLLYYREFGQDFRSKERKGYPFEAKNIFFWGRKLFRVDFEKDGSIYLNMLAGYHCDPLDVQLSEKTHLFSSADTAQTAAIAKYDENEKFRWAILWPYISWSDVYITDEHGGLYVGGYNIARTTKTWPDLDPDPDKEVAYITEPGIYAKYIETFRIKAEPSEEGDVLAPDKKIRWGEDGLVKVTPKAGYQVKEVRTLGGELLTNNGDGTYTLKGVKDTATVKAIFAVASSVVDYSENLFEVATVVSNSLLHVENGNQAESIEIVDLQGKIHKMESSDNIDLSGFADGAYTLRLKHKGRISSKRIIKK
ncbi:MAG: T9SS type A sorting domain-containing protein [Paludibacteraceae bacterium]|nr:T9SS type A sorting domain-containing protein [Paludibacteraceae bacterium]